MANFNNDSDVMSVIAIGIIVFFVIIITRAIKNSQYKKLTLEIQQSLGLNNWKYLNYDDLVQLKSSKAVDNYNSIQYFKEDRNRLNIAIDVLKAKQKYEEALLRVLNDNNYKSRPMYKKVEQDINENLRCLKSYSILVKYVSPAGNKTNQKSIYYNKKDIDSLINNPAVLMTKGEYNKYIKEQNKELLDNKHHEYYEKVNGIIDLANNCKDELVIKSDYDELDKLISSLFDRTVNSIKKIKDIDSEEWNVINGFISNIEQEVKKIIERNQQITQYYSSDDFIKIKSTCDSLMDSQREFNEYINEKAQSISKLFGTRIVRNETVVDDEYNYIRPYKKSITPFTAEVSSSVFASAENSPLEYVVKYFYSNKEQYKQQIQKLQLLVEELETLKEAKQIIDSYKKDYQQYLTDVPSFIMENDEDGFYSRLGFANISENVLTVEYKFSYTSNGGMAQRNFTIPMTEETIVELIEMLQSKLSMASFAKEQRAMMTSKLRQQIKERDDFTCKSCGNSTYKEPNLLLEIDHILPVSKGGYTVEENLQTLCWKCNRAKSNKIIEQ